MKKLFLILLLSLISVNAIKISYDSHILIVPESQQEIFIQVDDFDDKLIRTSCESNLTLSCPSFIRMNPQGQSEMKIKIQTNVRGTYPVKVKIGKETITFDVIVANQTMVFFNTLTNYQDIFSKLEERYGNQPLIEKGFSLIGGGWNSFAEEDYLPINGIFKELQKTLNEFYVNLEKSEPREEVSEPIKLGGSLVPMVSFGLIVTIFSLYKFKFKEKHIDNTKGLGKFIHKEIRRFNYD